MEMTGPVNQAADNSTPRCNSSSSNNNNKKKKVNGLMKCKCCVSTGKQSLNDGVTASNLCGKSKRKKKKDNICRESTGHKTNHEFNLKTNFTLGVKSHVEAFTSR